MSRVPTPFTTTLSRNERNEVELREDAEGSVVVKRFRSGSDWDREVRAYEYVNATKSLPIPRLIRASHNEIELEHLRRQGVLVLNEVVNHVRDFHIASRALESSRAGFPTHDLSRDKVLHRISYIAQEAADRGIPDAELMDVLRRFALHEYDESRICTLVHGDLKAPHLFATAAGLKFVDLGEMAWASPWYDLVFLLLEREPICSSIAVLADAAAAAYGAPLGLTRAEIGAHLNSALVYRALYNFGYALRHRPEKSVKRTHRELRNAVDCKPHEAAC